VSARTVPEWRGSTPDTPAPARVRLRVFEAHGGRCYLTGRKIMPGDAWELDHKVALINGGENVESNLAPALKAAHREKTNADVAEKAKVARVRMKHLGLWGTSKRKIPSRPFPKSREATDA
jgi:5-methylcytosine-specific restriction protein A